MGVIILIVIGYILLGCLTTLLWQIWEKCEYDERFICVGICLWPVFMLELIFTVVLPWITKHIYKFFVFVIFSTVALFKRNNSENINNIKVDEESKVSLEAMMHCPKCGCYYTEDCSEIVSQDKEIPQMLSVYAICPSCGESIHCYAKIRVIKMIK